MSGWVNASDGRPVGDDQNCQIALPVVPRGTKAVITLQGTQDGPTPQHWAQGTPTPYEVRRDALMAAATVTSCGGWMDAKAKTMELAQVFEDHLNEVLGR